MESARIDVDSSTAGIRRLGKSLLIILWVTFLLAGYSNELGELTRVVTCWASC